MNSATKYKNSYTHELFDLNQSPWNITVFLLKNNLLTIFVRFDALILDGRSIASLMLELFDGQQHDIQTQIEDNEAENSLSVHQEDMAYWERKFSNLSAIPALPWKTPLQHLPVDLERELLQTLRLNPESCACDQEARS